MECRRLERKGSLAEEREIEKLILSAFPLLVSTLQNIQDVEERKMF